MHQTWVKHFIERVNDQADATYRHESEREWDHRLDNPTIWQTTWVTRRFTQRVAFFGKVDPEIDHQQAKRQQENRVPRMSITACAFIDKRS